MKLGLFGYGKMGKAIEALAGSRGHTVQVVATRSHLDENALASSDVCIDFSSPDCLEKNLKRIAEAKKSVVIGTTGWDVNHIDLEELAKKVDIGILFAPNFSIGVQLLYALVEEAARKIKVFDGYKAAGVEYHHSGKSDAPSGTALEIARRFNSHMPEENRLKFSSVRLGSIPGIHTVLFNSLQDTITISHEAHNRDGFALGAIVAAEWLAGKKGVYTFSDCMEALC